MVDNIPAIEAGSGLRGKTFESVFTSPVMAVDRSDSLFDHIYVVWDQRAANGTDVMILEGIVHADGVQWDSNGPQKVGDAGNDDQWFPWITWDECTGLLSVVFMDSRTFAGQGQAGAETWVAVSPPHT